MKQNAKSPPNDPDLVAAITNFIALAQQKMDDYYARNNFTGPNPIGIDWMTKYAYLHTSRSSYAYIVLVDGNSNKSIGPVKRGDIMFCAGNLPAKNARGNVFSDQQGLEALDPGGSHIRYLRG